MSRAQTTVTFRNETAKAYDAGEVKFAVQVVTQRGIANQPQEVRSERQFIEKFGQVAHPTAEEAVRALRLGAILVINPLHHFDTGILQGTKATVDVVVGAETLTITAEEVGDGYNGVAVTMSSPLSRKADAVDITIAKVGEFTQLIRDVPTALNATSLIALNQRVSHVVFSISGALTLNASITGTLASGDRDTSAITTDDVIEALNTSFRTYNFDAIWHIVNLYYADVEVDAAFDTLAQNKLVSCHLPLPLHSSVGDLTDQRLGEGDFVHQPLNSAFSQYWAGQIEVRSIQDPTQRITLNGMGELMGALARKDQAGFWFSVSSVKYGRLSNDVLSCRAFSEEEQDELAAAGINYIAHKAGIGIKFNENYSLELDQSSPTSRRNIADCTIYNMRWLRELGETFLGEPADLETMKALYRQALPTINDLVARRGITSDWAWVGDQNAKTLNDLVLNDRAELQQGVYKVEFENEPIGALSKIRIAVVNTNGSLSVGLA